MNFVSIEDNRNNVVVKHKHLVWEARYRLSELGIKVVSMLISMIKINDDAFHQYALKVSDYKELIGSNSNNTYDYTHRLIKELLSKTLKIGDEQFAWVSYGKYVEGSDVVVFEINRHLKPYLLALQGDFLEYNIINILPLRSSYVIRLYELFKSKWNEHKHYNKNSKSYTFELKIAWLREHFNIPASYQYSSHIKKLIIDKAKQQFKEKTDIKFDYKEQKIGKKVDRLIITIRDSNKGSNDYLADIKSFIAYMRKEFVNKDILQVINKDTKEVMLLSLDKNGYLYDKYTTKEFDKNRAKEIWEELYKQAKEDKLLCLKHLKQGEN